MKKRIPEFTSDDDAERFVDTTDLTQYDLSGFKPQQFEFQAKAAQLNMRLPQKLLDSVKESAKARGIPYTRLVRETLEGAVAGQFRNASFTLESLSVGNIQLVVEGRAVLVDGRPLHLTTKERNLFEIFLVRKGAVITKEALLSFLYGDMDQPEVKLVDFLVSKLRKKLVAAGASSRISTVWGQGYSLQDTVSDQSAGKSYDMQPELSGRSKLRGAS